MYSISVFHKNQLICCTLLGTFSEERLRAFLHDLEDQLTDVGFPVQGLLVDLSSFKPATPGVQEMLQRLERLGLAAEDRRLARVVESQLVAHQLDRVAKTTGHGERLKHFWTLDAAREWLGRRS